MKMRNNFEDFQDKVENTLKQFKDEILEITSNKSDVISSVVGSSTEHTSSCRSKLDDRRCFYEGEFKNRRAIQLLSYLELENLTEEETLQMLPEELKTYPGLVRAAFSNNKKGMFPHSAFQDFQTLSSLVEKMLFERPVSIKGSKTEFSGNFTRKLFLNGYKI